MICFKFWCFEELDIVCSILFYNVAANNFYFVTSSAVRIFFEYSVALVEVEKSMALLFFPKPCLNHQFCLNFFSNNMFFEHLWLLNIWTIVSINSLLICWGHSCHGNRNLNLWRKKITLFSFEFYRNWHIVLFILVHEVCFKATFSITMKNTISSKSLNWVESSCWLMVFLFDSNHGLQALTKFWAS